MTLARRIAPRRLYDFRGSGFDRIAEILLAALERPDVEAVATAPADVANDTETQRPAASGERG